MMENVHSQIKPVHSLLMKKVMKIMSKVYQCRVNNPAYCKIFCKKYYYCELDKNPVKKGKTNGR